MKLIRSAYLKAAAVAGLALAALAATGAAQARDNVYWSVGVEAAPGVSIGVGNTRPVLMAPAPVIVAPQPVYVQPAPVYYVRPAPVVYVHPAPAVVYANGYWGPPGHWKKHRHWKHRDWDDDDD